MKRVLNNVFGIFAVVMLAGNAAAQRGTGAAGPPPSVQSASESMGNLDFLSTCGVCHGRIDQAPPISILQKLSPEKIHETITTGSMKTQAANLTDQQKIKIAEWVSGRRLGAAESGSAAKMPNACASDTPIRNSTSAPSWNGWSADALTNTRFQTAS